jgi:hypothetical protein
MAETLVQVNDLSSRIAAISADLVHLKASDDNGDYKITVANLATSLATELGLGDFSTIDQADRSVLAGDGLTGGGDLTSNPTITMGTPATITASTTNSTTATTHTHALDPANIFPIGGIIMWSGSVGSIPAGWLLCDGANSTPDLQDRFVIGAGSAYAVDDVGGNKDAIIPSHSHSVSVNDPGHLHGGIYNPGGGGITDDFNGSENYAFNRNTASATTGITATANATGVSVVDANLPPYYALAFIMKT